MSHDPTHPPEDPMNGQSARAEREYPYPTPEEPSHEAFERDEEPERYAVSRLNRRYPCWITSKGS